MSSGVFVKWLLVATSFCLLSCEKKPDETAWLQFVTKTVQTDYQNLADASALHYQLTLEQCQGENTTDDPFVLDRSVLQAQWKQTMAAWQRVQWVNFGPISDDNAAWKLQFWPDKVNLVEKKLRYLFVNRKPIDTDTIAEASVVVQGLSALEFLLFDAPFNAMLEKAPLEKTQRQCELMLAIADYLKMNTAAFSAGWQDKAFLDTWLKPAPKQETAQFLAIRNSQIIEALITQMERVQSDKLGGVLGYKNRNKRPNGYFAESWRSGESYNNIRQNLLSLQVLFTADSGYNLSALLRDQKQDELAQTITQSLDLLLISLSDRTVPFSNAVDDLTQLESLAGVYQSQKQLNQLLEKKLAPALGVVMGFNSNDGD